MKLSGMKMPKLLNITKKIEKILNKYVGTLLKN